MNLIILLLLVSSVFCYEDDDPALGGRKFKDLECPSKQLNTGSCEDKTCDDEDSFCFAIDTLGGYSASIYMCCPKNGTHCDETGMHSLKTVNYREPQPILEGIPPQTYPRTYLKNVTFNGVNKTFSCPYPHSWQLVGTARDAELPTGFEVGGEKLKTCTKNSECEKDEFCGQVMNPTYCGQSRWHHPYFKNNCIDRSNNGKPLQFCYQSPVKTDQGLTHLPDSAGLLLCNESCYSLPDTVCLPMDVSKYRYIKPDGTVENIPFDNEAIPPVDRMVPHNMTGICMYAPSPLKGRIFEELDCPSKQLNTGKCDPQNNITCDENSSCILNDAMGVSYIKLYMCCPKNGTHCDETGMQSVTNVDISLSKFPHYRRKFRFLYPKDVVWSGANTTLGCPLPFSWQRLRTHRSELPAGFEVGGKKLKTCNKNSDCEKYEFCGHAMNPTHCEQNIRYHANFKYKCPDKSNNGKPMQFCYKSPDLDEGLTLPPDSVGLLLCDNQESCESIPNTVCLSMDVSKYRYIEPDGENTPFDHGPAHHDMTGICVIAKVCSPFKYELIARPGTDSESCEGGDIIESYKMKLCCKYLPIRS